MSARRLEITVSEEIWDRLNAARGHEPRASFVKRALESALGAGGVAGTSGVVRSHRRGDEQAPSANTSAEVPSAPSRASAHEPPGPKAVAEVARQMAARPKPVPGVRPAREFVLDPRQAALNKAKKA